ncbi:uncharacterized protein LOC142338352 [Convolutriloba macropyga]|uniref:uncharacterized protein LOC142338352 n=1 Tax=Convolutriloba macropyga TaxID=536237 RepID=UPI003F521C63
MSTPRQALKVFASNQIPGVRPTRSLNMTPKLTATPREASSFGNGGQTSLVAVKASGSANIRPTMSMRCFPKSAASNATPKPKSDMLKTPLNTEKNDVKSVKVGRNNSSGNRGSGRQK